MSLAVKYLGVIWLDTSRKFAIVNQDISQKIWDESDV